jgi:hypothetical protein
MNNNEVRNSPIDDHDAVIRQNSVFASPLLIVALIITGAIAFGGLVYSARLAVGAAFLVNDAVRRRRPESRNLPSCLEHELALSTRKGVTPCKNQPQHQTH